MTRETQTIGQLFMVGFEGTRAPQEILGSLRRGSVGGVILFRRNLESPAQIAALTRALHEAAGRWPLLIATDQEGGRVARLPEPFTRFPACGTLGRSGSEDLAFRYGQALAAELTAVGITVNMAPVLDVSTNPANPIIGDRALGADPALVSRLGVAMIHGLQRGGVLPVGKHFPGHGDTAADSHLELPRVPHARERLHAVELSPFAAAIGAGLPALMTAHVLYPALDPDYPATLSPAILTTLLRQTLHFEGVIVSDDLLMRGVTARWGVGEAAVMFLRAGGDLILICENPTAQAEAMEAVTHAVRAGDLSSERLATSLARLRRLRAGLRPPSPGLDPDRLIGCEAHQRLAQEIHHFHPTA